MSGKLEQILESIIQQDEDQAQRLVNEWLNESLKRNLNEMAAQPEDEEVKEAVVEADDSEEDEEALEESSEDSEEDDALEEGSVDPELADLVEAFHATSEPSNSEGVEVGDGSKVAVFDKSPVVSKKGDTRRGGTPVEVHAEEHRGYELEAAPTVVVGGKADNNKAEEPRGAKRPKGALLDKVEGGTNDRSPIPARK